MQRISPLFLRTVKSKQNINPSSKQEKRSIQSVIPYVYKGLTLFAKTIPSYSVNWALQMETHIKLPQNGNSKLVARDDFAKLKLEAIRINWLNSPP